MTKCQFFKVSTSSCLREVVARIRSIERGVLNVCHTHKGEQQQRDRQMLRKEAEIILHELPPSLIDFEELLDLIIDDTEVDSSSTDWRQEEPTVFIWVETAEGALQ